MEGANRKNDRRETYSSKSDKFWKSFEIICDLIQKQIKKYNVQKIYLDLETVI